MKLNRLHMAVLAAMLGSAALVGCKKKEEPAPMPPVASEPAPPAPAPAPADEAPEEDRIRIQPATGG